MKPVTRRRPVPFNCRWFFTDDDLDGVQLPQLHLHAFVEHVYALHLDASPASLDLRFCTTLDHAYTAPHRCRRPWPGPWQRILCLETIGLPIVGTWSASYDDLGPY